MNPAEQPNRFTATRWSIVIAAKSNDSREALTWLCERYWFPLFGYVRGRGHSPEDSEDLVQSFFAWIIETNVVARADSERGRFRSFLLGCMNNFIADAWKHSNRQKRGGGVSIVSMHDEDVEGRLQRELTAPVSPETDYDRLWAVTLLDRALARVRTECEADGNAGRFDVLQPFLQNVTGESALADAATRLGLSVSAVKSYVHRLRGRFRDAVRHEVRDTVTSEADLEEELRHLFAVTG